MTYTLQDLEAVREACAKIVENMPDHIKVEYTVYDGKHCEDLPTRLHHAADRIRQMKVPISNRPHNLIKQRLFYVGLGMNLTPETQNKRFEAIAYYDENKQLKNGVYDVHNDLFTPTNDYEDACLSAGTLAKTVRSYLKS